MFGDDFIIGGIRAQASRLQDLLTQLEHDRQWRNNFAFYNKRLMDVEKALKKIRNKEINCTSAVFN